MKPWVAARYEKAKLAHDALMKCYPFDLKNIADEIWKDILMASRKLITKTAAK